MTPHELILRTTLKSEIFVRSAGYESLTPEYQLYQTEDWTCSSYSLLRIMESLRILIIFWKYNIRIFHFNYFIFERKSVVENIKIQSYNLTTQSPIFK